MKKQTILAILVIIIISGCTSIQNSENPTGDAINQIGVENIMAVKDGDTIKVDYVGTLEDGTVFDTSIESVAKEAGKFQEGRPYEPLEFKVGAGQMIKGFDAAVVGMEVNEEKTVTIPPEEAYGQRNEKLIQQIPIDPLKNAGIDPKEGMTISANGNPAQITNVEDGTVTIDFNHELAGKTLVFKITLKEIL